MDKIGKRQAILGQIVNERDRQTTLYGDHDRANLGSYSNEAFEAHRYAVARARRIVESNTASGGRVSWEALVNEEVCEAYEAASKGDLGSLREELIQVAALAVAWIENLDRLAASAERLARAEAL